MRRCDFPLLMSYEGERAWLKRNRQVPMDWKDKFGVPRKARKPASLNILRRISGHNRTKSTEKERLTCLLES